MRGQTSARLVYKKQKSLLWWFPLSFPDMGGVEFAGECRCPLRNRKRASQPGGSSGTPFPESGEDTRILSTGTAPTVADQETCSARGKLPGQVVIRRKKGAKRDESHFLEHST